MGNKSIYLRAHKKGYNSQSQMPSNVSFVSPEICIYFLQGRVERNQQVVQSCFKLSILYHQSNQKHPKYMFPSLLTAGFVVEK